MNVFGNYARYYDLLYGDKDYASEARYVDGLLRKHAPGSKKLLEFGSGTGRHATFLAHADYEIHGVDQSEDMITQARARLSELSADVAGRIRFSHANICDVRLQQKFDAVISLFHVVSYQITNEALHNVFTSAKTHLKPGGLFLFDCWYGPGVLNDLPGVRIKRFEDEKIAVTRIAEPVMYANENRVDVNYQIMITDKADKTLEEIHECHSMRYLFMPEIREFFSCAGMQLMASYENLTEQAPVMNTWNAYFVGQIFAE